eukprot:TRINITY_DN36547_c0_g1_i3.p1 TRINITY_DN36547_c0_g1~~TRINITY_DN36547_c0_g1_i3.p1  ORF type:complete len:542 (+),score=70.13 TRINITY_DN36547_c0_g1_i3:165-1790(+)
MEPEMGELDKAVKVRFRSFDSMEDSPEIKSSELTLDDGAEIVLELDVQAEPSTYGASLINGETKEFQAVPSGFVHVKTGVVYRPYRSLADATGCTSARQSSFGVSPQLSQLTRLSRTASRSRPNCNSDDEAIAKVSHLTDRSSGAWLLPANSKVDCMRAVTLNDVLRGFGHHLSSNLSTNHSAESFGTDIFEDFLSHDWNTPRFKKLCGMLWTYNASAAFVAALLVVSLVAGMQILILALYPEAFGTKLLNEWSDASNPKLLPYRPGVLCQPSGLATFLLALIFWQHLKLRATGAGRKVFFDKLCINQDNDAEKRKGILSLGVFLGKSDRLVVLWSKRYFTRLWCTFEIATWLILGRNFSSTLDIVPVQLTMSYVLWSVGLSVALLWDNFLYIIQADQSLWLATRLPMQVVFFLGGARIMLSLAEDLRLLDTQLKTFSIQGAECFCCTHGHIHPSSGAAVSCDRRVVYAALEKAYCNLGESLSDLEGAVVDAVDENVPEYLVALNNAVRVELRKALEPTSRGTGWLSWSHVVFATAPINAT